MYDVRCKIGLYKLKFHFLDHVVEQLDRFWSLELLNKSRPNWCNVHFNSLFWYIRQRQGSTLEETARVLNNTEHGMENGYSCVFESVAAVFGRKNRCNLENLTFSGTERTEERAAGHEMSNENSGSCGKR